MLRSAPVTPPTSRALKTAESRTVKLDIASRFDLLEMVQTVLMHLAGMLAFGEDAARGHIESAEK